MPFRVTAELLLVGLAGVAISLALLRRHRFLFVLWALCALALCNVLIPCFDLFHNTLCHGPKTEKSIALTFDDGPNEPYTSQILDILGRNNVPAAFFVVGKNVERYPEVVARMLREGYLVGNHTWDHRSLALMGPAGVRGEIEGWEGALGRVTAETSTARPAGLPSLKIFRAPHGWKTPFVSAVLKEKGYRLIGWSRGVWDSDQPGKEVLLQRLTRHPRNGEILLLHDGAEARAGVDRSQTVQLLPELIRYYRQMGFRFVPLKEMVPGDGFEPSRLFRGPGF